MVTTNERNEREVNVGGVSCLCGGTHVKNTAEIKDLKILKIKKVRLGDYSTEQLVRTFRARRISESPIL